MFSTDAFLNETLMSFITFGLSKITNIGSTGRYDK